MSLTCYPQLYISEKGKNHKKKLLSGTKFADIKGNEQYCHKFYLLHVTFHPFANCVVVCVDPMLANSYV